MKRYFLLAALVAGFAGTSVLFSQEAGPIGQVFRLNPIAGHTTQFEEAYKTHIDWHRQRNDDWNWDCWEYMAGPFTGQYAVVTGGHNWADFARGEMGAADRQHAIEHVMPHAEGLQVFFSKLHPELSSMSALGAPPPVASVYTYTLKPGMTPQFLAAVKKMHGALQAANWNEQYMWVEVVEGSSEGAQFYVVVPRNNWSDFEEPPKSLLQAVEEQIGGTETGLLREQFWSTVKSVDSHVVAYRTDLSHRP